MCFHVDDSLFCFRYHYNILLRVFAVIFVLLSPSAVVVRVGRGVFSEYNRLKIYLGCLLGPRHYF